MTKALRVVPALLVFIALLPLCTAETSATEAQRHFEEGMRLKSGDRAEAEFRRAIQLDENFIEAHRELQDLVADKSDSARLSLAQEYRRRVEANAQSALNHYLLGRLLRGKEAEAEYTRAVELDGNSFWARFGLLFHYYETGEDEKADAAFSRVVALLPQSTYAHVKLASGLTRQQRDREAFEVLEKARARAGNDEKSLAAVAAVSSQISNRIIGNLVGFLCYLLAALICSAFAGWAIKEVVARKTWSTEDVAGLVMILYSSLWFIVLCVSSAKGNNVMTGFRYPGATEYLMLLLVAFWPTTLYHTTLVDKSRRAKLHRSYRIILVCFYLAGIGMAGVFSYAVSVVAPQGQSPDSWMRFGFTSFFVNFVVVGILSAIMTVQANRSKPAEDSEGRAARRWELILLVAFLFIFLPLCLSALFGLAEPGQFLNYISTLMPLPFILVAFYYEARYAFMDVFIKKSLVAVLMVLLSCAYYLMVVVKVASWGVWRNIRFAELVILLPLICAVPFLAGVIERWVDRYVFKRRRSASEVLSGFSRAIRRFDKKEQLAEIAAAYIREAFQAQQVWVGLPGSDQGTEPPEAVQELSKYAAQWDGAVTAEQLTDSDPWLRWLMARGMSVVTAVRSRGEVVLYLALGRKQLRDPYLSGDIDLLNSLTDQLEFALDTVWLERERREQEIKQQELKVLAGKAELKALRAQVNPHFLFNALNTIASLIKRNPAKAEVVVETLADVFRHALAESGKEFVPLSDELDFINSYLEIEKARFGNKLQVKIDIQREAEGVRIPAMVLQPLVENAVKHGIAPKVEGGKVEISAHCKDGLLEILVADNGVGFEPSTAQRLYHDGLGVRNVRDRLEGIYGGEGRIRIESTVNHGTRIHVSIPIEVSES